MKPPQVWTVPNDWAGQDAICIGGGPSLTGFDFSVLRDRNTIGCNDAFRLGSDIVQYCVFGDSQWWQREKYNLQEFTGHLVTNSPSLLHYNIPGLLKCHRSRDGLHRGSTLGWNYSTGALAINLAVSLGATRIFLLGYDLNITPAGAHHWHKYNTKGTKEVVFKRFLAGFHTLKRSMPLEVQTFNVTNGTSKLDAFPCISFPQFHAALKEEVAA